MHFQFQKETKLPSSGVLVLFLKDPENLGVLSSLIPSQSQTQIIRALKETKFEGKKGTSVDLVAPEGLSVERILILGTDFESDVVRFEELGALLAKKNFETKKIFLALEEEGRLERLADFSLGWALASYSFDGYKKEKKEKEEPTLVFLGVDENNAKQALEASQAVAQGAVLCRDLVTKPANVLTPAEFVQQAKALAVGQKEELISVSILAEKELEEKGFGALLSVGQGSAQDSYVIIVNYQGGKKGEAPLALVGKGVTFDTGGISLKPASGMWDMKFDMGGAAAVLGTMKTLLARKAQVNVVGIIGAVENMPSGDAIRPGDVVTSLSGQSIEVLNTDAEGRLVLADILWYVQETFKPKTVINLATLTGAIMVSLGMHRGGLFSNDDTLVQSLEEASKQSNELLWHMPCDDTHKEMIKSPIADLKNIGGRWGGSCTAAAFLKAFIQEDVSWAHLDIAGVVWSEKASVLAPAGATGYGVRLLDQFIRNTFETSQ